MFDFRVITFFVTHAGVLFFSPFVCWLHFKECLARTNFEKTPPAAAAAAVGVAVMLQLFLLCFCVASV